MQKKSLLYFFAAASLVGLAAGVGFFAEFKTKETALESLFPDKSQINFSLPASKNSQKTATQIPPRPAAAKPGPETENPEPAENKFSFAIIGDTQNFSEDTPDGGLQRAVKNIEPQNPDVVMTEGDLLGSCDGGDKCERGLNRWKNALGSLYSKTYEVMGNHDRTGGKKADELWQKFFSQLPQNGPNDYKGLVYSFDFKNSHFVVLNSEKPDEHVVNKIQRDWLEQDLADNKKENTFVFFHEPAYPVKHKISSSLDAEPEERDALWEILKKHKVTGVFNGHEHINSRRKVDGIYQFIFGNTDSSSHELPEAGVAEYSYKGGHFGMVEVDGNKVSVKVHSDDGNLLDTFQLK